jgi:hypothetical protein
MQESEGAATDRDDAGEQVLQGAGAAAPTSTPPPVGPGDTAR